MLKTIATLLTTIGILGSAGLASAQEAPDRAPYVRVHDERDNFPRRPPPAPRFERIRTRPGYVWVAGNYEFRAGRYVWVRGHFERARRQRAYMAGHWSYRNGHYVWVAADWQSVPYARR